MCIAGMSTSSTFSPFTYNSPRDQVQRDWENRRRIDTINQLYERLREQYTVTVESLSEETAP